MKEIKTILDEFLLNINELDQINENLTYLNFYKNKLIIW
jgi:hypothetical protein